MIDFKFKAFGNAVHLYRFGFAMILGTGKQKRTAENG